jgi:putative phage-type endonuclease
MDEWTKDLTLEQGTKEWKSARSKRLGGSEIASVLRISPYKTRRQLWEEKVGITPQVDISKMPHVKRGIDAEPIARAKIENILGVKYTTPVLIHPKYEWAVSSLDGLCDTHTLEIKTMGKAGHEAAAKGEIPDYYECQIQWGLLISGKPYGVFASYRPEDDTLHMIEVKSDETRQHWMLEQAIEFMGWVFDKKEPPEDFVYEIQSTKRNQ